MHDTNKLKQRNLKIRMRIKRIISDIFKKKTFYYKNISTKFIIVTHVNISWDLKNENMLVFLLG